MAIQQKISARKLRRFRGQRVHGAGGRPVQGHAARLGSAPEGMAPEIDGKVYLNDIEGVNDARSAARPATSSPWKSPKRTSTTWSAASWRFWTSRAPPRGARAGDSSRAARATGAALRIL